MELGNLRKKVLMVLTIITAFFVVSVKANAAVHEFSPVIVDCSESVAQYGANKYQNCAYDYVDGVLNDKVLTATDTLSPGQLIMVGLKYNTTRPEVITYNAKISYNSTYLSVNEDNYYFNENYDYPGPMVGRPAVKVSAWSLNMAYPSPGRLTVLAQDSTNWMALEDGTLLAAWFLTVNDNAASQSMTFSVLGGEENISASKQISTGVTKSVFEDIGTSQITLYGAGSSVDPTLETLSLTSGSLTFANYTATDAIPEEFTITVPSSVSSLTVNKTLNDSDNVVSSVTGNTSFTVGDSNTIYITNTVAGEVAKIYTIHVKKLNGDATLSELKVDGTRVTGFTPGSAGATYSVNDVAYATTSATVSATATDTSKAVIKEVVSGTPTTFNGTLSLTNSGTTANTKVIRVESEECEAQYASVPGNENCSTETYTINVYKKAASTVNTLDSLSVTGYTFKEGAFASNTENYTIENVASTVTSVKLTATKTDSLATMKINDANYTSGTEKTITLDASGTTTVSVEVKSESGSTKTYTVTIKQLDGTKTLSSMTVVGDKGGTLDNSFAENTKTYTYEYDSLTSSITISATAKNNKATVNIIDATGTYTLTKGSSQSGSESFGTSTSKVIVYVVAEDNSQTEQYTINLTRALSQDKTLKTLTVKSTTDGVETTHTLTPGFTPGEAPRTYTLEVDAEVSALNITAEPNFSGATVAVSGNAASLTENGTTQVIVTVTPEKSGIGVGEYKINVTRKPYEDTDLTSLTVKSMDDTKTYTLKDGTTTDYELTEHIPYGVSSLKVIAPANTATGQSVSISGNTGLTVGDNTISVVVNAQKTGVNRTYTIKVVKDANTDNSVGSITIGSDTATVKAGEDNAYEISIAPEYTTLRDSDIIITATDSTNAQVSITPGNIDLSSTLTGSKAFTITAQDTTKIQPYTLYITRRQANEADLKTVSLTLDNGDTRNCTISGTSCNISVPEEVNGFVFNGTYSTNATSDVANGSSHTITSNPYPFKVKVTSEDGTVVDKEFTINITRDLSSNKYLSGISVTNADKSVSYGIASNDFNKNTTLYTVNVGKNVDTVYIDATVEKVGSTTFTMKKGGNTITNSTPISLSRGSNEITITTLAEDGNTTETYTVDIVRAYKLNMDLASLTLNSNSITLTTDASNNQNTSYPFSAGEATELVVVAVPDDSDASIDSIKNVTTNSVAGSDNKVSLQTGSNTVEIVVKADDNTATRKYTVTVTKAASTDNSVGSITIGSDTATVKAGEDYAYEISIAPSYTTVTPSDIIITATDSTNAQVSITPGNIDLISTLTGSKTFTITAEDTNEVQPYTLYITRRENNEADLKTVTLNLDNGDTRNCTISGTSCNISVPEEVNGFVFNGTYSTKATSDVANGSSHTITSNPYPFKVKVTSEDGSVVDKEFTVNITRDLSSNKYLSGISVTNADKSVSYGIASNDFNKNTTLYTVNVGKDVDTVYIDATVEKVGSTTFTMKKGGNTITNSTPISLSRGSNEITITTLAEDGNTTETYTVDVVRAYKLNMDLASLTLNSDSITLTTDASNNQNTSYPHSIASHNTYELVVVAVPDDSDARITRIENVTRSEVAGSDNKLNLSTGTNIIEIDVQADNGTTTRKYTVTVDRPHNTSTEIKEVYVAGVKATWNEAGYFEVEVGSGVGSVSSANVTVVPKDAVNSYDNTASVESIESKNIDYGETKDVAISMVAEDGSTRDTYTVKVTRQEQSDAEISSLKVTNGTDETAAGYTEYTVDYVFEEGEYVYKANLPEGTNEFYIVATAAKNGTITGDGRYDLDKNGSTVTVTATSQNGANQSHSKVKVTRTLSTDNELSNLVVSHTNGTTTVDNAITYNKDNHSYEVVVPDDTNSVTISGTRHSNLATITGVGTFAYDGNVDNNVTKTITITSETGVDNTYTVVVKTQSKKNEETNALLNSLEVIEKNTSNKFDFATSFVPNDATALNYTIGTIDAGTEVLEINATYIGNPTIKYYLNNTLQSSNEIDVSETYANNEIEVEIISEDGSDTNTYKIAYYKGNNDVSLREIKLNASIDEYIYDSDFDENNVYVRAFETYTNNISLQATADSTGAIIDINLKYKGTTVAPSYNSSSATLDNLNSGNNPVEVTITSSDRTASATYTVIIKNPYVQADDFTNITLDGNAVTFDGDGIYTETLTSHKNSVLLNATASAGKTIKVNNNAYTDGTNKTINLIDGLNTITVDVTKDGITNTYTIKLTNPGDAAEDFVNVKLDGSDIAFDGTGKYTETFTSHKDSVVLNATAGTGRTIKVNGVDYTSGTDKTINLSEGLNTITLEATKDSNTNTYTIELTNPADTSTDFVSVKIDDGNITFDTNNKYTETFTSHKNSVMLNVTAGTGRVIQVNGVDYTSGTNKLMVLGDGLNTITITATKNGNTNTYTIELTNPAEEPDEKITSANYGHTIDDDYILTIADKHTDDDVKNQLDNDNSKLVVYLSDGTTLFAGSGYDYVGTGMIVKLIVNGNVLDSKVIVVKGDTDGDGIVDMNDAGDILNHFMGRGSLTDAYLLAGDTDGDSVVDMNDAGDILNYFMGRLNRTDLYPVFH